MKIHGTPVEDSDKELTIKILPRDVKAGAHKNATACAAAKALIREGLCQEAKVHINRTYLLEGDVWKRYETPPALRTEIVAFDRGGAFEPGEYKLRPIPPSDKAGARPARAINNSKRKSHANKGLRKPHVTTGIRKRFNEAG